MAISNLGSAANSPGADHSLGTEFNTRAQFLPATHADDFYPDTSLNASAVSWAAILAGATAAAALSLILLILGVGLGLSSVSPWANEGISAANFGLSTIIWLATTQVLASGMGGYLAGRLRARWVNTHSGEAPKDSTRSDAAHSDEVYFRDTAHGFLTWAVATLATAALLASAIGTVTTGAAHATAAVVGGVSSAVIAGGAATAATTVDAGNASEGLAGQSSQGQSSQEGVMGYFVDALFRQDANTTPMDTSVPGANSQSAAPVSEVTRIFINAINLQALPAVDAAYLGQLVAKRTGLPQQEAEKRVNEIFSNIQSKKHEIELMAKEAADKARKATIYGTLWFFVSFLMGAFSASLAATFGGRSRDA